MSVGVGGQIAAFFDLDGTLLAPPSLEWSFITYLAARDEIGVANVARWLVHSARNVLRNPRTATLGNKQYLAGISSMATTSWECELSSIALPLFVEGTDRLKWHLERRHSVFLVTGTLTPLARAIARHLPCGVEVCGTEVEVVDDHFTGWLAGVHMTHDEKARAVREIAAEQGIDLAQSFAYGNRMSDFRMLEAVGNPMAVNPSRRLERLARRRGWKSCEWCELREGNRVGKQTESGGVEPCKNREARDHTLTAKAAR